MDDVFKNLAALETDRLILRKLKSTDCHDIFDFTSLPEVCEFLSWEPHSSIAITQSFIESVLEKYKKNETAQWCIELKSTNVVIGLTGFISFSQEHLKGEIAYILSPIYQAKGYMTEAINAIIDYGFETLELNRIEAKCEIDNFSSEKVMQKLGMRQEGCMRGFLKRKGQLRDYKFYSLIRSDKKIKI